MNDYLREHVESDKEGAKEDKILVCPADPHNITLIFNQLMQFIQEIEKALKVQPGAHCTLYAFLMDYIKDVFLGQIHVDISNSLNSASQSLDAWKSVTDTDVLAGRCLSSCPPPGGKSALFLLPDATLARTRWRTFSVQWRT
jgi:hypothetical protein